MVRRIADGGGQRVKLRRLFRLFDQPGGPGDGFPVPPDLVRFAAQAGAVAGGARRLAVREEFDMLAFRPARRAARLAKNSGRADGADHAPVPPAVAAFKGIPGLVIGECRHHRRPSISEAHLQFLSPAEAICFNRLIRVSHDGDLPIPRFKGFPPLALKVRPC
jgi:hypothetical protein